MAFLPCLRMRVHRQPIKPASPDRQTERANRDTYSLSQNMLSSMRWTRHCPFHPPDVHPSFAVNRARGFWICFHETNSRTGRYIGGDAIAFYKKLTGLSYKEVLRELQAEYGGSERSS